MQPPWARHRSHTASCTRSMHSFIVQVRYRCRNQSLSLHAFRFPCSGMRQYDAMSITVGGVLCCEVSSYCLRMISAPAFVVTDFLQQPSLDISFDSTGRDTSETCHVLARI